MRLGHRCAKNDKGDGVLNSPEERARFSEIIADALLEILNDIIFNPDQIRTKGQASMDRILVSHKPEDTALKLMKIYKDIFQDMQT